MAASRKRCPKERQGISEGLHEVLVPARVLRHSDPPVWKARGHFEKSVRAPSPASRIDTPSADESLVDRQSLRPHSPPSLLPMTGPVRSGRAKPVG